MGKSYEEIFTKEEIEEDKKDLIEMYKSGTPIREIMAELGRTCQYIKLIREQLIQEGRITEEEIKFAQEKHKEMYPPAQGGPKQNKVYKPKEYTNAIKRQKKIDENKDKVLTLLLDGKSPTEISKELQITYITIKRYIDDLINEGKIENTKITWHSENVHNSRIDRSSQEYIDMRDNVIQMMREGYKSVTIRKRLNLTPYFYNIYSTDIIKNQKILSSDEVREKRALKHLKNLQFVATRIKMGDSQKVIANKIDECLDYNGVAKLVKELVELEIITKEEVKSNGISARQNAFNKEKKLSAEEQVKFIQEKVLEGYSPKEIVDIDMTNSISMHSALYQKRKMIDEGIISAEEAKDLMNSHRQELLEEQYISDWTLIKAKTRQGMSVEEIANELGRGKAYVIGVKKFARKRGQKITKQQINKYKQKREKRENEERLRIEKSKNREKKIFEQKLENAIAEERRELNGDKIKVVERKSLIKILKDSNDDKNFSLKFYETCYNLYLYHPDLIDEKALEKIMNGLKKNKSDIEYEKMENEINIVIKEEVR